MLARILSSAVVGIDALQVEVEVDVARGLPVFTTVGLPDNAVKESKDRVRSAVKNSGYTFPTGRITVNLAPAELKKEGVAFDLPVALGILSAESIVEADRIRCSWRAISGRARKGRQRSTLGGRGGQKTWQKTYTPKG